MIWTQMKLLLPSFAGYWIFLFAALSVGLFVCTRAYSKLPFKWSVPFAVSLIAVVIMIANMLLSTYQTIQMSEFQQKMAPHKDVAEGGSPEGKKPDPALQMKAEFLSVVDKVVQAPEKINPELKKNLFTQYSALFPTEKDKQEYFKNIYSVFQCQRFFWEDAQASYQSKKAIKSEARQECENTAGTFFNRDKLIGPANVKGNEETIAKLAAHKRIPASEG